MTTSIQLTDACDCEPFVYLPAWWSGFLFHVISPRELAVYTYIAMLGVKDGVSRPTALQIQRDMGLQSDSVVFEAIRRLEEMHLLRRLRNPRGGGNAYIRPSCQSSIIYLLETGRVDSRLRPIVNGSSKLQSDDVSDLVRQGLQMLLGDEFPHYENCTLDERRDVLIEILRRSMASRTRGDSCVCAQNDEEQAQQA
jgi:hypothetical protein